MSEQEEMKRGNERRGKEMRRGGEVIKGEEKEREMRGIKEEQRKLRRGNERGRKEGKGKGRK